MPINRRSDQQKPESQAESRIILWDELSLDDTSVVRDTAIEGELRRLEYVLRHSGLIDWNESDWAVRELALELLRQIDRLRK